ncbi:uncharacterized protein E0L32_009670 [Thyridium curvatum]|uniref:Protein HRI1 n=1 Tax=Thyridium curvatum TaxID=1093900 RepID=A0A507AI59_9PEZI|nr:uncharacterized protein E0L32_009670 [Thyridium curvatum]TPX08852.1 hypothetical protein E0L32_009670 [Thyridium curvatum]
MGSVSIREHIRWLPDPPSEPTSTLVLTSPENRFVDIRVLHSSQDGGNPRGKNANPAQTTRVFGLTGTSPDLSATHGLDWAIAGASSSVPLQGSSVAGARHTTWWHWVDSRTTSPETAHDEGDVFPRPDGRALETGRMVNPATGLETAYEEVWRDEQPGPVGGDAAARVVVLQAEDGARGLRGMVVRLGRLCQGLLRDGPDVTVERWAWSPEMGWEMSVKIGKGALPCSDAIQNAEGLALGYEIRRNDQVWKVVERSDH